MAKKNRTKPSTGAGAGTLAPGEVGPRQPCPCGSGKRFKNCHGASSGAAPYVARPFAGMAAEAELVALRELVPAATAPLRLVGEHADRTVTLATLLPGGAPALVREDGEVMLGLQVQRDSGDVSRDLAVALLAALEAAPGSVVEVPASPGVGPRLGDLLADEPLEVTVHDGFAFWVAEDEPDPGVAAAIEAADDVIWPTRRLPDHGAAYWTDVGSKEHLRWVMGDDEDALLDALARLHAADEDRLVEGGRLVGMFRAHGVLAPVWDLPLGTGADVLAEPATTLRTRLEELMAENAPLTASERSARAGLANRQVTIR
ncbi:SEC-C domain-containing protein [Nocardioidaceae bacterium]|nr:SEC-C domain-containing protein [Nocardioidaceae bacterium]